MSMGVENIGPASTFERVPQELTLYKQWVNWRLENEQKVPVNPSTLGNAGVGWPNTWSSFAKALENYRPGKVGLGFVLTESDPFVCVDPDKCIDETGELTLAARAVLDVLHGYVELSPSGHGLHMWVKSEVAIDNRRTQGIEIYSSLRWMTVTGRANPKGLSEIPERTEEVQKLLGMYFARAQGPAFVPREAPAGDLELWERLFQSKEGSFFRSLFAGDTSVCYNDHSRAVILLANQLAMMTHGDAERMKRLLLQTELVDDKWFTKRGSESWIDFQIRDAIRYTSSWRR